MQEFCSYTWSKFIFSVGFSFFLEEMAMSFRHALESSSDAEIWIMWTEIGKAVVDLELSCACLQ